MISFLYAAFALLSVLCIFLVMEEYFGESETHKKTLYIIVIIGWVVELVFSAMLFAFSLI